MTDGISYFIERAGQIPVLTKQQEIDLAKRIEAGDHSAKQTLVEHNIRLAVSVARKYQNSGIPFEDLVQEALIGVDRAAEKFDYRKGFKFSTYAMWWIRHMIQRALHKNRATIRIPGHIVDRKRKLERHMREHPESTLYEAADALGITHDQADDAMEAIRVVASLDQPFVEDEGGSRYGVIADETIPDPAEITLDRHPGLSEAMAELNEQERRVIELRFGFDGPVRSRDECADILGVRPHVVQRAQRSALTKLTRALKDDDIVRY